MVEVALPIWLMIVLGLGLVVLFIGAAYGLMVFLRQMVGAQVDFEGAIPLNEFTLPEAENPRLNPRLRGVDPRLAAELMRQAEADRGERPRGS